jgi:hypothetical protein
MFLFYLNLFLIKYHNGHLQKKTPEFSLPDLRPDSESFQNFGIE